MQAYKILTGKYDTHVTPKVIRVYGSTWLYLTGIFPFFSHPFDITLYFYSLML